MKVIGKIKDDGKWSKYICEIGHEELEKFLNLYYGKLSPLDVGKEIDLGKGYDFAQNAKEACKQTSDFLKANAKIIKTITDGITFIADKE